MKTQIFLVTTLVIIAACNDGSKDSVQKADSANHAKIDSNSVSNGKAAIAVNKNDADFLVKAIEGGMMEIDLGNIAKMKSQNKRVQNFGKMMVADHGDADAKIKDLAQVRTVTLPTMTGDDKSKMIRDMNEKKAKDFDKDYIDAMVKDHKEDIKEFESASDKVQDTEIRAFILNTLPVLRKHLDSCEAIQQSLSKK
ncbi:MAG: DUF4142 domain-containing protein [Bacteroidota bacterium]